MKNKTTLLISELVLILILSLAAVSQTTVFTYQGKLTDTGSQPTGTYQMEFRLFDVPLGGQQIGQLNTNNAVSVTAGVFTVNLNFGDNNSFPGPDRFLQISVRRNAGESFVTLNPRQMIATSPYAIRTLSALQADDSNQLGGVGALQYLRTNGDGSGLTNLSAGSITTGTLSNARLGQIPTANIADSAVTAPKIASGQIVRSLNALTDNVTLAAGSNITLTPTGNTLTIASTGGAGDAILNQTTQQAGANFNIAGTGTANVFNALAQFNINGAGRILSSAGSNNLFAGIGAGNANPSGGGNTFVGGGAGGSNTSGSNNSFVGANAGSFNTMGGNNSFVGAAAGFFNTASDNSFFGTFAGQSNMTASQNSFFGKSAGQSNTVGGNNSFVGFNAGSANTMGSSNSFFGTFAGNVNTIGTGNTIIGTGANVSTGNLTFATAIGANVVVDASNKVQIGRLGSDKVAIGAFGSPSVATAVCVNAQLELTSCASSSLRYKTNVQPFRTGLSVIERLRPVTFDWKEDQKSDLGLVAEEVAAVEPLLSTYNPEGELDGVRYTQLTIFLINAVKEQQAEISSQQSAISRQQDQIARQQKQIVTLLTANAALNTRLRAVERGLPGVRSSARPRRREKGRVADSQNSQNMMRKIVQPRFKPLSWRRRIMKN